MDNRGDLFMALSRDYFDHGKKDRARDVTMAHRPARPPARQKIAAK
jgi:hypothetical protein